MLSKVISQICEMRNETLSAACRGAEVSYTTLRSQLINDRKVPFETIDALANYWNLPLSAFSAFEKMSPPKSQSQIAEIVGEAVQSFENRLNERLQTITPLGVEDILDWLLNHNGTLEGYERFAENIDLYHPVLPGDNAPSASKIGKESLASKHFGIVDKDHFHKTIQSFPKQVLQSSADAHLEARKQSYTLTDLDIDVVANGYRVLQSYRRVIAPVRLPDGQELTLVYCRLLPFKFPKHAQTASAGSLLPRENSTYH